MKTMDTTTIIEIIKMIDIRISKLNTKIEKSLDIDNDDDDTSIYWNLRAGRDELQLLNDNLQIYIEGKLNAEENQTEQ